MISTEFQRWRARHKLGHIHFQIFVSPDFKLYDKHTFEEVFIEQSNAAVQEDGGRNDRPSTSSSTDTFVSKVHLHNKVSAPVHMANSTVCSLNITMI
jgi:hypothetical protein